MGAAASFGRLAGLGSTDGFLPIVAAEGLRLTTAKPKSDLSFNGFEFVGPEVRLRLGCTAMVGVESTALGVFVI